MRWILLVLALLLLVPDALAKGDGVAWSTYRRVPVWDHTGGAWGNDLATAINDFNAAMPKRVPRLVYRGAPNVSCPDIARKRRGIAFCFDEKADGGMVTNMPASRNQGYRRIVVQIQPSIRVWMKSATGAFCHELMHAVTGISHPRNVPDGLDSCVIGTQLVPGAIDTAFAKKVYRRH